MHSDGLRSHTHPRTIQHHCSRKRVNAMVGENMQRVASRSSGTSSCSTAISPSCTEMNGSSGNGHRSAAPTERRHVSTPRPNMKRFATSTATSENTCPYNGRHRSHAPLGEGFAFIVRIGGGSL